MVLEACDGGGHRCVRAAVPELFLLLAIPVLQGRNIREGDETKQEKVTHELESSLVREQQVGEPIGALLRRTASLDGYRVVALGVSRSNVARRPICLTNA